MTITRAQIEEIVKKHAYTFDEYTTAADMQKLISELMALLEPERVERPVPPWVVKAERADVLATPKESPIGGDGIDGVIRFGEVKDIKTSGNNGAENPIAGWEEELDEVIKQGPPQEDSYQGKLWSTAIQKCFEAPFVEVAMQHLLRTVAATERQRGVRDYLIDTLAHYHKNVLESKGFDWFFVLSNDLEARTNPPTP